jgi:hypothetical protein
MSARAALRLLAPQLPGSVRAHLEPASSDAQIIRLLNLDKVADPENMRWLTSKRLSHSDLSPAVSASLQRKLTFLDECFASQTEPSVWLGYFVHENVRDVFLIDLNRSAVLVLSEPIVPSASL